MTDIKHGFIVTYFKINPQAEKLLRDLITILSKQNYYLILASHTAEVPLDIQAMCDFYFYQELNIVDDRKYSHGVAENNLIELALLHCQYKNISWVYKMSYDVVINDVSHFNEWKKEYKYDFVSCYWGDNFISTNSFFANVNFILKNIKFYKSIEEMFEVNNVLEHCWQKDIIEANLKDRVYSYKDKFEFFGENKIDNLFYDYNSLKFWYDSNDNKFYIFNGDTTYNGIVKIYDYYSDTRIFLDENMTLGVGTTWIVPPWGHLVPKAKNGFYLEIYVDGVTHRKNWGIQDFSKRDPLYKAFSTFKGTKDQKYNEYVDLSEMDMYNLFDVNVSKMNNFVDVGANFGIASSNFIKNGVKTYLVEADPFNVDILNKSFGKNNKIKIIDKAVSNEDGEVIFFLCTDASVVSSIFEKHVEEHIGNGNKEMVSVPSITPNTLIENYVDEEYIDLIKIDIEGAEYMFFEAITDENLKKIKRIIIEFHDNQDYKVMSILKKLAKNDFYYKLANWGSFTDPYIIENKMGIIYANNTKLL
jgi:FkbM family methyltransferase